MHDITVSNVVYLVELKKHESPGADRVRAVERKNTQRDISTLVGELEKPFNLVVHYVSVAESPKKDRLVENCGKGKWSVSR